MFAGLRKPMDLVVIVVTLLAYGCPVQAIVHAFKLDERTVASWRDRAGQHCEQVHHALVEQGQLDLVHVQADEIRVKGRQMIAWMGLALMVSTRLWLAGTVSLTRDTSLADRLMQQVRRCAQSVRALLICTDGWAAYPNSIRRAFREKLKETAGRGRACLRLWPQLHIGIVIKHTEHLHVVRVTRHMAYGTLEHAMRLLGLSHGGTMLNTAFIERFNGTMRERLASLTRKCRHATASLAHATASRSVLPRWRPDSPSMSGASTNCSATKSLLRSGLSQSDGDGLAFDLFLTQRGPHVRSDDLARRVYARPPVNGGLPCESGCVLPIDFFKGNDSPFEERSTTRRSQPARDPL